MYCEEIQACADVNSDFAGSSASSFVFGIFSLNRLKGLAGAMFICSHEENVSVFWSIRSTNPPKKQL